jgi:hypothetical protein
MEITDRKRRYEGNKKNKKVVNRYNIKGRQTKIEKYGQTNIKD